MPPHPLYMEGEAPYIEFWYLKLDFLEALFCILKIYNIVTT